jgi:hypothetical protein
VAHKWKDIRKGPPPKPLSPEEYEIQAERLSKLDQFCQGIESARQFQLLEPADRYRRGEITFEEFKKHSMPSESMKPGQKS